MHVNPLNFEQERDALRLRVFSSVAHDLGTPLAGIIGSLGTLDYLNTRLSAEQRDVLIKIALSEAQKLDGFITSMLEAVKP